MTSNGRLQELLKTKEKSSWLIQKVVGLRELFITEFKSHFKRGFTKVVVARAGRLLSTRVVARRTSTV